MAPEEWQHALLSYEAAQNVLIHVMVPETGGKTDIEYPTNTGQNPMDLDEPVLLKDRVTIPAFASKIVSHSYAEDIYERPLSECHDTTATS